VDTRRILELFPELSKNRLYYLEKSGLIEPKIIKRQVGSSGERTVDIREFDEEDVRKLAVLIRCQREGLTVDRMRDVLKNPELLRQRRVEGAIEMLAPVTRTALLEDSASAWRTFARHGASLLLSESCLVLTADEPNKPPQVQASFVAGGTFRLGGGVRDVRREPDPAWEGRIDAGEACVNLFGADLATSNYVATKPGHLPSGRYFSVLSVPLFHRQQRFGWLVFENRLGANDQPDDGGFFDAGDEFIARALAASASSLFEVLLLQQAQRSLIEGFKTPQGLRPFLKGVLKLSLRLLGAYRGDAIWRDRFRKRNMVTAQTENRDINLDYRLPEASITHRALRTGSRQVVADVSQDPSYFETDPCTKSELAVPMMLPGSTEPVGALNLESDRPANFDEADASTLEFLAGHAALYGQMVEFNDTIASLLLPASADADDAHPRAKLESMLRSIDRNLDLEKGIVYIVDYRNAVLRCEAIHGYSDSQKYYGFAFRFDERSLANHVFETRTPHISTDPKTDKLVSPKGREYFQIESPIIGVPLQFGDIVIGVIVVWSDKRMPREEDLKNLRPFTKLAVTTRAGWLAETRQANLLKSIQYTLTRVRSSRGKDDRLKAVASGLLRLDFDRVRIFEFHGEKLVCVCSLGGEPDNIYKGYEISPAGSVYARKIIEMLVEDEPRVKLFDPEKEGVDPDGENLGKPPDLPWASVPLMVSGEHRGHISVDNKSTRRAITPADEDTLLVYAALAGQALAAGR
jgi:GAF domain-containing protein/DNA-binding transcriptional MerR regulator